MSDPIKELSDRLTNQQKQINSISNEEATLIKTEESLLSAIEKEKQLHKEIACKIHELNGRMETLSKKIPLVESELDRVNREKSRLHFTKDATEAKVNEMKESLDRQKKLHSEKIQLMENHSTLFENECVECPEFKKFFSDTISIIPSNSAAD